MHADHRTHLELALRPCHLQLSADAGHHPDSEKILENDQGQTDGAQGSGYQRKHQQLGQVSAGNIGPVEPQGRVHPTAQLGGLLQGSLEPAQRHCVAQSAEPWIRHVAQH